MFREIIEWFIENGLIQENYNAYTDMTRDFEKDWNDEIFRIRCSSVFVDKCRSPELYIILIFKADAVANAVLQKENKIMSEWGEQLYGRILREGKHCRIFNSYRYSKKLSTLNDPHRYPNVWCINDFFLCRSKNSNLFSPNRILLISQDYPIEEVPEISRCDAAIFDLRHPKEVRNALIFDEPTNNYVFLQIVLKSSHSSPVTEYTVKPARYLRAKPE